ncbi:AGAP002928-PA-like protein [Anopheles sinensis]|uniref:AGAP002928-PA-like protein n=1 Tax=Anopheles sinensis TaxID=74873 RepID=A0A084VH84_ANOSI|nr:AGAP002928-PA-like protein [Anopheles sinensis]
MPQFSSFFGVVILLALPLLQPPCCEGKHSGFMFLPSGIRSNHTPTVPASAIEHREPTFERILAKPTNTQAIDSKAKLISYNRALAERLQHAQTDLRPLQMRATSLQRRFLSARSHPTTKASRAERNGLLRDALRLRTAVERKLVGFGGIEQSYRNMRSGGLPRGWLDRDTERQMELNERVYKNIIELLVHLIECPVNIIHDIVGPSAGPTSPPPSPVGPEEQPDYLSPTDDADSTTPYYVEGTEGDATNGIAEPWLEEFHY